VCSGLQTQGRYGCPPCGPEGIQTQGKSSFLKKVIYMGARRFLHAGNELRKSKYDKFFDGKPDNRSAPIRPTRRYWEQQWQRVLSSEVPLKESGMTFLAGFYRLPYFKVLNFCGNFILKHISKCFLVVTVYIALGT
jgi:hypothetical protein